MNNNRRIDRELIAKEVTINDLLVGHALDVSPGGMFINVSADIKKGTPVMLKFQVNNIPLVIKAMVKHSHPGIGIGVEFLHLTAEKKELIAEFMEQCRLERETIETPGGQSVILMVDDRPESVKPFERQLSLAGFKVLQANNSIEAIKQLDKHRVDLVITDLLMDGMNGFMLIHLIKQTPKFSKIPVAVLSATNKGDPDIRRASGLGIVRFFMKHNTKPNIFAEEVAGILLTSAK